jgi:hypothetical protein
MQRSRSGGSKCRRGRFAGEVNGEVLTEWGFEGFTGAALSDQRRRPDSDIERGGKVGQRFGVGRVEPASTDQGECLQRNEGP